MDHLSPAKNTVILSDPGMQKTKSGLEIPNTNERSKPETGIVVAIGKGVKPVDFKVGDKIVYRKYMENKTQIGTNFYNFIDFKDILAVVVEEQGIVAPREIKGE